MGNSPWVPKESNTTEQLTLSLSLFAVMTLLLEKSQTTLGLKPNLIEAEQVFSH